MVRIHSRKEVILFVAEGNDGVDAGGTARREVGSSDGNERQQRSGADKCDRIGGADAKEETAQGTRKNESEGDAHRNADQRKAEAFAYNDAKDLAGTSAERDANADLADAQGYGIRHDAIDADSRKDQSQSSKDAEQPGAEAGLRHVGGNIFFHGSNADERLVGVNFLKGASESRGLELGIADGAQDERELENRQDGIRLAVGQIHLCLWIEAEARADVANNADDFHHGHFGGRFGSCTKLQALADRVFVGKMRVGHGGVDDDDGGFFLVVCLRKPAALKEGNFQGFEVAGCNSAITGGDEVAGRIGGAADDVEVNDGAAAADRQEGGSVRSGNAWKLAGAIDEAVKKFVALFGLCVGHLRERYVRNEQVVGTKTGRGILKARKTAEEKAGPCQKKHGEGNFRNDKQAANAMVRGARGRAAGAFVESLAEIEPCGAKRGDDAEEHAGKYGNQQGEEEHPTVQADGEDVRNAASGESE